ncbi:hypothetical protein Bca101_020231 [Brassica carinata]
MGLASVELSTPWRSFPSKHDLRGSAFLMATDPPSRTLGLSSVGGRVRSRRGNETSDPGKSASSSLISTAEVESPKFDETATVESISSNEEEGSSPVGPTSKIGAGEIEEWRR